MSRIIVLGYELPSVSSTAIEARSIRTGQLVSGLLSDEHEISLVVSHSNDKEEVSHGLGKNLKYHRMNFHKLGWPRRLKQIIKDFSPDGVLAVMFYNCLRTIKLGTEHPIWMDIYGDRLAETQIAEVAQGSNRGHRTTIQYMHQILQKGDVFSTCSLPQKYALIGQLGMASRLNRHNAGYDLVHSILPAPIVNIRADHREEDNLSLNLPDDSFVVLWCGGYNVWTDVNTLFEGIQQAMDHDSRIRFLSVGGAVSLSGNQTYELLEDLVKGSIHQDRFHFLGWLAPSTLPSIYSLADVGINLDAYHYETLLGTRTRIVEMLRFGLPVISTRGCELSEIVEDEKLGMTFPIGNPARLSDSILALAKDPQLKITLGENAKKITSSQLAIKETTLPLREWANHPYHAPDHDRLISPLNFREAEYQFRSFIRGLLWKLFALESAD